MPGPILVIGASGFIGSNILRDILSVRDDVVGTKFSGDPWRLQGIPAPQTTFLNLEDPISVKSTLRKVKPKVIFDCSSFGAYSFEVNYERIHSTNYTSFINLMEMVSDLDIVAYIHSGSSSEYGLNSAAPPENAELFPNSHYAVSKAAGSHAISFYGKVKKIPVVNLRLYSVYGPYEDSSRLIPNLCEHVLRNELPPFASKEVARDFIHVKDVVESFILAALKMTPEIAGESFNIGSGVQTSLGELATLTCRLFSISEEPRFLPGVGRAWDVDTWYANPEYAAQKLEWRPRISLEDGLKDTLEWWRELLQFANFSKLTKKQQSRSNKTSISAVVACYKDSDTIPIVYQRLVTVFQNMDIEYEIIFVNDGSPDDSSEKIREISAQDPYVMGITHSRFFGSQAAFRSGMEMANKEACVLLYGDLRDPPEIIPEFVKHWREGAEVVFGRRSHQKISRWLKPFYESFHWLFAAMSNVPIPKNAGDFSLLDHSVVHWILQCSEKDSFFRGLRAYVGFKQVGIDYTCQEFDSRHSQQVNGFLNDLSLGKRAILSFSHLPLHVLTIIGFVASFLSILFALFTISIKLGSSSEQILPGISTTVILIVVFGSFNLLGLGLLGEYIGKIMEEAKQRPPFIRMNRIERGELKRWIE